MTIKLEDYKYDAERCMRCGGCKWVDHIYLMLTPATDG